MNGIIGIIVIILDVIAILDVFKSAATTGKKVLWTALIVILPVIGLLLYFFLGRKKA